MSTGECLQREWVQSISLKYTSPFSQIQSITEKHKRMSSIEERVRRLIAEQLKSDVSEVKDEASFVDDLGADSLDTVELVMALEEEFETEIPDEDAENITTVREAIEYVKNQVGDDS